MGVPRCWSSVPAASREAGGDTSTASRRGRGGLPRSSRQVGELGLWAHSHVPGQQTDLDADPVSYCMPCTIQVSFQMLLLGAPGWLS